MESTAKQYRGGFVAIAILVVIAILAMLYAANLTGIFGLGRDYNVDMYADQPWFEEDRLLAEEAFPVSQPGRAGQTVIDWEVVLEGPARRKDADRGIVEIVIYPSGRARGQWECEYEYTDSTYKIQASFEGNIDPAKKYEDAQGKNKKLLYLITKGRYRQVKTNKQSGISSILEYPVYVIGWIKNDYSAAGKLFLMTGDDGKSNVEYAWETYER